MIFEDKDAEDASVVVEKKAQLNTEIESLIDNSQAFEKP